MDIGSDELIERGMFDNNPVRYHAVAWEMATGKILKRFKCKELDKAVDVLPAVINTALAKVECGVDVTGDVFEITSEISVKPHYLNNPS